MAVTVDYETVDGTAIGGTDYRYLRDTLTIPAGQTSGTITIPILSGVSADRTFYLNLYNPSNVILTTQQAAGIIPADFVPPASGSSSPGTTQGRGICGQGVGAGNLIGFYAVCWLGLIGMKWRRAG